MGCTVENAKTIHSLLGSLKTASQGTTQEERAILKIATAQKSKHTQKLAFDPENKEVFARMAGPFLGSPEFGDWAWHSLYQYQRKTL